jgi:transcriptional regulator with XRE-family HTH domain
MKQRLTALKAAADAARQTDAYQAEGASIRFTEDLVARMKASGLTRSALAEKIGSSPAYITKILRGDTNFTLDSMVKIASALGCELTIGLRPLARTATAQRRSPVSYRDAAPLPSPMLNDEAS